MSLVGMRKVHIPRGCDCHLLLVDTCYLCSCLCHSPPGPGLLSGSAPLPWPLQLPLVLLPSSLCQKCTFGLPLIHTSSTCPTHLPPQMPFQVSYLLASLFSATKSSHTVHHWASCSACWHSEHLTRQQTIIIIMVMAVSCPSPDSIPMASPGPGPGGMVRAKQMPRSGCVL